MTFEMESGESASSDAGLCCVADKFESCSPSAFLEDVVNGLSLPQKSLPCKYFYDERGSELFERICSTEEYYVTRTERSILAASANDIAASLTSGRVLIEPGAGSAEKTRLLVDAVQPDVYVPIDISGDYLQGVAEELRFDYPDLSVEPLVGDFTEPIDLDPRIAAHCNRVVFFPGSTLGNFAPEAAIELLKNWIDVLGEEGQLLIGIDVAKEAHILEAAYDDGEGYTGRFNQNLLVRINRELDADFDVDRFRHRAIYSEDRHRVEMHLVSDCAQVVTIGDHEFAFAEDEFVHTENSHKFPRAVFQQIADAAGYCIDRSWTDERSWFDIHLMSPKS